MADNQAKNRITGILEAQLQTAREQLVMAEEGILLSIDGAPEGINLTQEALRIRVEQIQSALDRHRAQG